MRSIIHRARGRFVLLGLATLAATALAAIWIGSAGAVVAPSTFEGNDGNMIHQASPAGRLDWDNVGGIFHQVDATNSTDDSIGGGSKEDEAVPAAREEAELYEQAGLKPAFVKRIVATPNDDIFIPTRSELLREDVLTR